MSDSARIGSPGAGGKSIRGVRLMVDELRAEPMPDLPWDAMEAELFARIDQRAAIELKNVTPIFEARRTPSVFARVFGLAAAAAAIALGVSSAASSGHMPSADEARHRVDATSIASSASSTSDPGAHDLAALRPGDVIEAGDTPVTFAQAGLVRWTLSAGSALRVATVGFGHTVQLERGSLRAEVTPRDASEGMVEAFAVEVDGTRVAVHGTAFSVRREDTRVIVDVEHGAVAIGPRGNRGTTTGRLLVGPSRGSFSLNGGRSAWLLDRDGSEPLVAMNASPASPASPGASVVKTTGASPTTIAEPVALPQAPSSPVAPTQAQGAATLATNPPSVGAGGLSGATKVATEPSTEPKLSAEVVRTRVERCLRGAFESPSSVLESVSSTLTIDVNPDGTVRAARFSPPLNAELTACAGSALGGRFAPDASHLAIPFSLHR